MRTKFGHPVVFSPGFRQQEFILVVSFCCSTFKLDVHTVTVSLLAMFGGYAQGFRVRLLRDRTFKFSFASKSVGFEFYNNDRIVEQDFEVVFSQWNFGGPNWHREEVSYYNELDKEWTLVGRHGKVVSINSGDRRSYSLVVRDGRSVFERLSGPIQV